MLLAPTGAKADRASLKALVEQRAAALDADHWQHILALQELAKVDLVRGYYSMTDKERAARRADLEAAIKGRSIGLEMCLIDNRGNEHMRAVRGRLALPSELAKDEVDAPFFKPAMALKEMQTFVSPPYYSPDADQWVIGFVVPIVPGTAILHYEDSLSEYQEIITKGVSGEARFLLLVDRNGYVVGDSRHDLPVTPKGLSTEAAAYFNHVTTGPDPLPGDLAKAILAGGVGEARVTWNGKRYDTAYVGLQGYTVVGFELLP